MDKKLIAGIAAAAAIAAGGIAAKLSGASVGAPAPIVAPAAQRAEAPPPTAAKKHVGPIVHDMPPN